MVCNFVFLLPSFPPPSLLPFILLLPPPSLYFLHPYHKPFRILQPLFLPPPLATSLVISHFNGNANYINSLSKKLFLKQIMRLFWCVLFLDNDILSLEVDKFRIL